MLKNRKEKIILKHTHATKVQQQQEISTTNTISNNCSNKKKEMYKCKQCVFVCLTKEEFWQHQRSHIKPEKILTCPKCPFVTEYKHHLEYHLRNHMGSKPYKCSQYVFIFFFLDIYLLIYFLF